MLQKNITRIRNWQSNLFCASVGVLFLFLLAGPAKSATFTKADNMTALNVAGSWTNNAVPGSADTAMFDATFSAANNIAPLGTNMTWGGIAVSNNLQNAFTIDASGTNILRIGTGGINASNANQDLTFNCPVAIGGAQVWALNSGRNLTFNGPISAPVAGANTFLVKGGGTGTMNFRNNFTNRQSAFQLKNYNETVNIDPAANGGQGFLDNVQVTIGFLNNNNCTVNILSGTNVLSADAGNYVTMGDGNNSAPAVGAGPGNGTLNVLGGATWFTNHVAVGSGQAQIIGVWGTGIINVQNATLHLGCDNGQIRFGGFQTVSSGGFGAPVGILNVSNNASVFFNPGADSVVDNVALGQAVNGTGAINLYTGGSLTTTRLIARGAAAASSTFNFNGGTLKVAPFTSGNQTLFQNVTIRVNAGGAIIDDGGLVASVPPQLQSGASPDGGLVKLGSGTLVLNYLANAAQYNGPTTVSNGTLKILASGLGWGGVSVASNATFTVAQTDATIAASDVAELASLTMADGSALTLSEGVSGNPGSVFLYVAGPLTTAGKVTINITNAVFSGAGQYPLINLGAVGGSLAGDGFGAFVLGSVPPTPGSTFSLSNNVADGTIDLVVAQTASLTWDGTVNGVWDINTTPNWKTGRNYVESGGIGPAATFDDTLSGPNTAITVNVSVHPLAAIFNNTINTYTLSGSGGISGTNGIVIQGSGGVVLANANTTTGTVAINSGTLQLGDGVSNNGSVAGGINDNGALIVANPQDQTISSSIAGNGTITKNNSSTLTLTAANSFSGSVTVNAGTLALNPGGNNGSFALFPANSQITANNAILLLQGANALSGSAVTLLNNGVLSNTVPSLLTLGMLTAGGPVYSPGEIDVTGTTPLILLTNLVVNAPTFGIVGPGLVAVANLGTGNTLTLSNAWSILGDANCNINGNGSTINEYGSFTNTAFVNVNGVTWNVDLGTNVFNANSRLTIGFIDNLPAVLNLISGTMNINPPSLFGIAVGDSANPVPNAAASSGTCNVLGGVLNINQTGSSVSARVIIGNGGVGTINVSAGQLNFIGSAGAPIVLGGDFAPGQGTFAHPGCTGMLTVNGTGAVTITNGNGGLLLGGNNGGVGTTQNVANVTGIINLFGGSLTTAPGIQFIGSTNGGGSAAGYINFSGGILRAGTNNAKFLQGLTLATVSTNGAIIDDGGFAVTIGQSLVTDPNLSGADGGLTKLGSGTLTLTNASTYTGPTLISNGTLQVNGSLASSSPVTVANGGTLSGNGILGSAVNVAEGGLLAPGTNTPGTLTINNNLTLAGSLTIAINETLALSNSTVLVSGVLTNGGTGVVTVTNLGPGLTVGDSFTLFNQPVLNGSALTIASSGGVTWTNKLAVDGSIQVLSVAPPINPLPGTVQFNVSGSTLNLAWPTNLGWILQVQTNTLPAGLGTNWVAVPGSTGLTNISVTITPANGSVFYRMVHP